MQTTYAAVSTEILRQLAQMPIWVIDAAYVVFVLLCIWASYYGYRRGLGHERFKGQWYSARQLQMLKQELYSGVREGRLPDSQTMAFLDRHVYGKESELRRLNGNGWL